MKIPEIGPGEFPQIKKVGKVRQAEKPQTAPPAHDTVDLGSEALLVSRLKTKLPEAAQPNARVAELTQQVEQGTYQPDPNDIAARLLGIG